MPRLQQKRVLITVKAYPSPSKKYGETVCCAGIDIDTGQWIRLYPIPFRDLESPRKFDKYTVISVKCYKAKDDHRIESYKVDRDSIERLKRLGTKDNWAARGRIILPTVSRSFCGILKEGGEGKSLGVFKPSEIEFSWQKADLESEAKREGIYAQGMLFDRSKKAIEQIPFDFYYHFKCAGEPSCSGHKLCIVDWEIKQSYRKWRSRYASRAELLYKIREKWLGTICGDDREAYFYVGNMKRFQNHFMVLGVFYPRKVR
ncbi:MAG: hypothetical protein JSU94_20515 [Phycisphaerales bacterium]|nr:MAG: hypothetical protein JSU94_20515 [Phycisphaerales bacterium]